MEEVTRDADVTFYEAGKPSGHATGVQINTLLANRHWIVNDFKVPKTVSSHAMRDTVSGVTIPWPRQMRAQ
jgi:hypothetical protein